ncbi:MAG: fibronectin type III domain-containing protein [Gemmatimonadota bacterium]
MVVSSKSGPSRAAAGMICMAAALLSCDEVVVEPVPVAVVSVTPGSLALDIGATRRLQATATDASGNALPRPITWRSADPSIATVDGNGLVSALAEGTVDITAEMGSVDGSATVSVSSVPAVAVDPATATVSARRRGLPSEEVAVAVSNAGGGVLFGLTVSVAYDGGGPSGWLESELDAQSAPTTLRLRALPGEIAEGSYGAQVTVSGAGPAVAAVLEVTFQVVSSAPTPPQGLVANGVSETEIELSWIDASDDEETFRIERRSSLFAPWVEVGVAAAGATSHTDGPLTPGTTYAYRMRACNAAGCSDYVGPVVAATHAPQGAPAAPSELTATATSATAVSLEWIDNASNEEEFRVERRLDSSDAFELVGTTDPNVPAFMDEALAAGTGYVYRVQACNAAGCSGFSNEEPVTTPAAAPPNPPTDLVATGLSESQIRLDWADNSADETTFELERRNGSGGGGWSRIAELGADVITFTDTGLPEETKFDYRVRACSSAGCSAYSNRADGTTLDG